MGRRDEVSEPILSGYVVEARLGRVHLDVSLIASSPERAISRVRGTLVHSRRSLAWMHAEYIVAQTMTLAEFKAGREAGLL